jgi:hypothetical protein
MLGIVLSVAIFTTNAEALPEPKVAITYSLKTADCLIMPPPVRCGAYWQDIAGTPFGLGDAEFVFDTANSMNPDVTVIRADPLVVTIEYTLDSPGGIIIDGPVELTQTDFGRDFVLDVATTVTTLIDTELFLKGTGTLSGSASPPATITWDNSYEEAVLGSSDCAGDLCGLAGPWPQDLSTYTPPAPPVGRAVVLPTFTVFANTVFADEFASDNGTPNDPSDDIDRPDANATVNDTWYGVEVVPEPSGEILLLTGVLGLAGLCRLRERGGASALCASRR